MKSTDDKLVRILARKYATANYSEEDLFQEGILALMKAEMTYKKEVGVKFETYASRVITNRFIDLSRKQHDIDAVLNNDETASDFSLDDQVNLIEIKKVLAENVTEFDRAIFNSYIEGFSYEEMGKIFELPRKKIDNTVQKVKRIIKSKV